MSTYGVEATPKIQVEGINITTGSDANTASIQLRRHGRDPDRDVGYDAEVGTPGLHMIAVLKSGEQRVPRPVRRVVPGEADAERQPDAE